MQMCPRFCTCALGRGAVPARTQGRLALPARSANPKLPMNPLKEAQASLPTERVEVRPGRVLAVHHRAGRVIHGRPGDVVIFVHGSCASLVHWRAQIEHFQAAGFAIVAYDFLGCGRSAKPHEQHCQNAPGSQWAWAAWPPIAPRARPHLQGCPPGREEHPRRLAPKDRLRVPAALDSPVSSQPLTV